MALELPNSIFIHVPKTAGRTIRQALLNSFYGNARGIGVDPFHHGAHFPIGDPDVLKAIFKKKPCFAFVRKPTDWLRSLFYQRQRKGWNWQDNYYEEVTKSEDLNKFTENWLFEKNSVYNYMQHHFTMNGLVDSNNVTLLRMEHMVEDLTKFLDRHEEEYDNPELVRFLSHWVVGTTTGTLQPSIDPFIAYEILENEPKLEELY